MSTLRVLFGKYNFLPLDFLCNSECNANEKYFHLNFENISINKINIKKIDLIHPKILDLTITKDKKNTSKLFYLSIMEENGYSKTMINKFLLSFGKSIIDIISGDYYQIIIEEPWNQNVKEFDFIFNNKKAKIIVKYDYRKYNTDKDLIKNCINLLNNEINSINYNLEK